MLKLHGKLPVISATQGRPYLVTLTKNQSLPNALRAQRALLTTSNRVPDGYRAVFSRHFSPSSSSRTSDIFFISGDYDYLDEGDIVRIDPDTGSMRTLYRHGSAHNTILLTEQCNNYCLMCSQPPKDHDDSWLLKEAMQLVSLMPSSTERIGFSGGEPTLYGRGLIDLLALTKRNLPRTAVDVLSNGRSFKDFAFAKAYREVGHPNLTIGIPVYSDDAVRHDYVVQAKGAFDETIQGILNLKKVNQRVEIRVVIHKQTIDRLVQTCEFIARNLLFVDHVALMGLEITGFTRANLDSLWIDPFEYKDILSEAVQVLAAYGLNISVYNHQLCVVNADIAPYYRKSISDWKNELVEECSGCLKQGECGGFFSSSKMYRYSDNIKPIVS